MPRKINKEFFTRILYGAPDGMRFTQDTPVMREIWLSFAQDPGVPKDVLITPWEACQAHDVGDRLHQRTQAFREQVPEGTGRKLANIADLPGVVAARLYFDEVVNLLLPQTKWWEESGMGCVVRLPTETQTALVTNGAFQLKKVLTTADSLDLGTEVPLTFPPGTDHDTTSASEMIEISDSVVRFLVLLAMMGRDEAWPMESETDIDPEGAAEGWKTLFREPALDAPDPEAMIFNISANRRAESAVAMSVVTTKADAAYRMFDLDCSRIGWAVIDSGIDSGHPAFARLEDQGKPLQITESRLASRRQSRVVASFDLSRFRDLRSRDILLTESRREQLARDLVGSGDEGLTIEQTRAALRSLASDVEGAGPVDFSKIGELLRLPHDSVPENPHGTHVAGIIGGYWSDRRGTYRGMCPDIELYDFRVLSKTMKETEFAVIGALRLINHINRSNALPRIHGANLSLSIPHDVMNYACGRTPVCIECETLVNNGVVVVAAAGNHGYHEFKTSGGTIPLHTSASITDPGNAAKVITVGSTHKLEPHNYGVSYFSSRGPTGDGRSKPDIVAPGEKIMAPVPNGRTARKGGTSMASPHVSGAAAMLMARFPEMIGDPDRIKQILCESATDLARERDFQGSGMLDVLRALQSV